MNWLGYSPADLVPFSQQTWLALIAGYNRDHVTAVIAGMALGLVVLGFGARPSAQRLRLALALLGLCWLWVSWAFLHQALGTLLWASGWLAWAFAAQAVLLSLAAAAPMGHQGPARPRSDPEFPPAAWWLLAAAVLLWPLLQLGAGRDWAALGWFGSAPDATAAGTLAVAAMTPGRRAWLLLPVPAIWCLISATMLGVFDDPLWWLPAAAALLTGPLLWLTRRRPQGPSGLPPPV